MPEWPAANTLLKRLANSLGGDKGLKSPDGSVRLMCIDFLGLLVQRLCADCKAAEAEAGWLGHFLGLLGARPAGAGGSRRGRGARGGGARCWLWCAALVPQLQRAAARAQQRQAAPPPLLPSLPPPLPPPTIPCACPNPFAHAALDAQRPPPPPPPPAAAECESQGEQLVRAEELTRAVALFLAAQPGPLAAGARDFVCARFLGDQLAGHKALLNKDAGEAEAAGFLKAARWAGAAPLGAPPSPPASPLCRCATLPKSRRAGLGVAVVVVGCLPPAGMGGGGAGGAERRRRCSWGRPVPPAAAQANPANSPAPTGS
jgi:hypothetical protein